MLIRFNNFSISILIKKSPSSNDSIVEVRWLRNDGTTRRVAFSSSWRYPGETEQDFPYKISLLREATYKNEHSGSLSWKNRGLNWFWKGVLVEKRGRQERFPSFSCNSFKKRILGEQISSLLTKLPRPGIFVRSQEYVRRQVVSAIEIRKRASVLCPIASHASCGISWTCTTRVRRCWTRISFRDPRTLEERFGEHQRSPHWWHKGNNEEI